MAPRLQSLAFLNRILIRQFLIYSLGGTSAQLRRKLGDSSERRTALPLSQGAVLPSLLHQPHLRCPLGYLHSLACL